MRKVSLISLAVLAAFSMSAIAGSPEFNLTNKKPNEGDITLTGVPFYDTKFGTSWLKNTADNGAVDSVSIDNESADYSSYIKLSNGNLSIGEINFAQKEFANVATIEFDTDNSKNMEVGRVNLVNNSLLRVQEYEAVNPTTAIHFKELNLSGTSALALGVADKDKGSSDDISIDVINVTEGSENSITGIAVGGGSKPNGDIKVGSINIDNNKFSLAITENEVPKEFQTGLSGVELKNSVIHGQDENKGVVTINISGENGKLIFGNVGTSNEGKSDTALNIYFSKDAYNSENSQVTFGEGAVVAKGTNLSLTAENAAKGSSAENVKALNKLLGKVDTTGVNTTDGQVFASTSLTATSDVFDTVTAQTNEAGEVDTSTMRTYENAEVFSFAQLHSVGVMQWREEMNHMQLRLGEIRDAAGYNNGAWARIYNGKDEYGSQDVENKYYGVQVGYDHRLEGTNWIIGGAFSYARGDSIFSTGEGDNHNFTFTGYGTWLADNGLFVDVTGKVGRLSNDITIDHYTSDYDTNAVSVTAEAGWRFALNDIFYVEPQAEMMYGHIMSADYRTQTYKADTEAVDMWVGRLGFQTGLTCPEKKGGVYFRASVLHDFDGDAETKFTGLKSGDTRKVLDELGGTWYEMGIGANYNVTDNTYLYADFQYANGGEIDTPWRWNLGVRVNF